MKYMVKINGYIMHSVIHYKAIKINYYKMDIIQHNPNENFFEQLPYEIVCHIFKFIEKDYDKKILEINYSRFNYIINEDTYIDKFRYYIKLNTMMLHFNHPIKALIWTSTIRT
jgi:hypothetical protein